MSRSFCFSSSIRFRSSIPSKVAPLPWAEAWTPGYDAAAAAVLLSDDPDEELPDVSLLEGVDEPLDEDPDPSLDPLLEPLVEPDPLFEAPL